LTTKTPTLTAAEVWKAALDQLRLQTTQATFNANLKGTTLLEAVDGVYRVGVTNEYAKDWLENRLRGTLERTLSNIANSAITVEFVVTEKAKGVEAEAELPPSSDEPVFQPVNRFDFPGIDYQKLYYVKSGFQPLAIYHTTFLQAYLGLFSRQAFALWFTLQKFDKRNIFKTKFKTWWTHPQQISIRHLAGITGASTPTLSGRLVPCWAYEGSKVAGEPYEACCGLHKPSAWYPKGSDEDPETRVCKHWKPGAIEALQAHKLLLCQISPSGRTTHFQVWRVPPLLKPSQVERLPEALRGEHDRWLADYGHLVGLDKDTWYKDGEGIDIRDGLGFVEGQEIENNYAPNPFT